MQLSRVEKSSAYEAVQKELVKFVVAGSLKVGDRLPSEAEMAQALGVSRPVVREALGSLRTLGLVASRKGKGTYVAATKASLFSGRFTLEEMFEARLEVEKVVVRLAAARMSDECEAEIQGILTRMQDFSDEVAWAELDWSFHTALATATGNRTLVEISENLRAPMHYISMSLWGAGRNALALREHQQIFSAVRTRDQRGSMKALASHIEGVHEFIKTL